LNDRLPCAAFLSAADRVFNNESWKTLRTALDYPAMRLFDGKLELTPSGGNHA
jgi:hypothetical protein